MKFTRLGDSGLVVSRVSLGSWLTFGSSVDAAATGACVRRALELGINVIDTADVYAKGEAERVLGEILQPVLRSSYVLASKAFWPMSDDVNDRGLSRKHLVESAEKSLRRLRTDYLDLFQCHRWDPETPLVETVRAMGDLIRQGKILYWGVSCWSGEQITAACHTADRLGTPRPISNQPPYNLLDRGIETDVLPASLREGLSQIVFSPLAQGVLSGKYSGGSRPPGSRGADERRNMFMGGQLQPETLERVDRFSALAATMGTTPARLALAALLHRKGIASVIVGATKVSQIEENVGAVELELGPDVIQAIDGILPGPWSTQDD